MAYKPVFITPVAEEDFNSVIDYLLESWSLKVTQNFIDRFEYCCSLISNNPNIYSHLIGSDSIQKCVLTKHNTLYFREELNLIRILSVFDTRQNPDKSKFRS